jgi:ABC-type transport system involved in cytochrome c biogenesis permease component
MSAPPAAPRSARLLERTPPAPPAPPRPPGTPGFWAQLWAVARKDLLLEARSRERVVSMGTFAVLVAVVLLASAGFIALGTLFGAVAAHTRLGETLLPVLLLPLLTPVVILACTATQRLLVGRPTVEVIGPLKMLGAFALVFLFACTVLFGAVLEE